MDRQQPLKSVTRHKAPGRDRDWRDMISRKIDVPTAIFTGDNSNNVLSQRWIQSQIKGSEFVVYSAEEEGDHFLAFKNPVKFHQRPECVFGSLIRWRLEPPVIEIK
jgi:pimeloyl-ACP methyl ester carboxylesterase